MDCSESPAVFSPPQLPEQMAVSYARSLMAAVSDAKHRRRAGQASTDEQTYRQMEGQIADGQTWEQTGEQTGDDMEAAWLRESMAEYRYLVLEDCCKQMLKLAHKTTRARTTLASLG